MTYWTALSSSPTLRGAPRGPSGTVFPLAFRICAKMRSGGVCNRIFPLLSHLLEVLRFVDGSQTLQELLICWRKFIICFVSTSFKIVSLRELSSNWRCLLPRPLPWRPGFEIRKHRMDHSVCTYDGVSSGFKCIYLDTLKKIILNDSPPGGRVWILRICRTRKNKDS